MRHLILFPVFLCLCMASSSEAFFKVADYSLDASFIPENSSMTAAAHMRFASGQKPDSTVTFYLHGELWVDSIIYHNAKINFSQEKVFYQRDYSLVADKVTISAGEVAALDSLTVFYGGYFHPSNARSPSDYMRIDPTGVYLRAYGYSLWYPVFIDDKSDSYRTDFSRVQITVPVGYSTVLVGHKAGEETRDSVNITNWSAADIELYELQCSVRQWEIKSAGTYYTYFMPDSIARVRADEILGFAKRITEQYGRLYRSGTKSSEIYIIELPRYGEISSANVTGITSGIWNEFDRSVHAKRGLGHEMVHPFVHVNVAQDDPLYALAIEGFPSYFHLPVLAGILGEQWYHEWLEYLETNYINKKATGKSRRGWALPEEKPLDQITADEIGHYKDLFILADRAVLFFNYLRVKMGPGQFEKFGRELFNENEIDYKRFKELIGKYLPDSKAEADRWLSTNEFPDEFRLANLK